MDIFSGGVKTKEEIIKEVLNILNYGTKEEQGKIEAEIADMEATLRDAIVIAKKVSTNKVGIGCVVKVYDEDFDEEIEYKIVGSTESDPLRGMISNQSPVGAALLGKTKGEEVVVPTPSGHITLKILGIK